MPGVCIASGWNGNSTSFSAISLAMIAIWGLPGRIFTSSVSAVTLSLLICRLMRASVHFDDQRSKAIRTAKRSHTCCPSGVPVASPYMATSSGVTAHPKYSLILPSTCNQPPIPHGDASVPISI